MAVLSIYLYVSFYKFTDIFLKKLEYILTEESSFNINFSQLSKFLSGVLYMSLKIKNIDVIDL